MICDNCKVAGQINMQALSAQSAGMEAAEHLAKLCRSWHMACLDWEGCPCQHVIGQVLNYERIRQQEFSYGDDDKGFGREALSIADASLRR